MCKIRQKICVLFCIKMRQQFRINFSLLASFSVVNPDPELLFRIWIQLNMKEQISKNVISLRILDFVYCRTVVSNKKWQIVDRFFYMIEFKLVLFRISIYTYLTNKGWIRIRMEPELLHGSGSGTRKNSELDPDPE